jgi:hypothetical protein
MNAGARKPLGETRSWECRVKSPPSRALRLCEPGETRRIRAATAAPAGRAKSSLSPNPRLQRTPLRAPLSRKPLGP